jgi:hypothetical protein
MPDDGRVHQPDRLAGEKSRLEKPIVGLVLEANHPLPVQDLLEITVGSFEKVTLEPL